ncbi:proton-conducting transporter membrane subunit [Peloplasma aerotolerans]|uniref:Proton-conducting transporter membrane subunit n=1 Tax=Peloplasma aerotolerans TaxID=3044389 RepID=A0AAW6U5V3_9MOLU|nr:proton-conducting transporter membrane subunit [Mariniplasma sp. M4Ah]MDI6453277.1 proton-conducting transporter membrane subunit [Mariniplasma sp. M4Ah]MDR4968368.1 proton-conducting transporter membrane subunit [Acholeplasmataceae bacterium]
MIEQLPIINLLLLLSAALAIPLFKKRAFTLTLVLGLIVLLLVFASSVVLLVHVNSNGAFYYRFGNYTGFIGIELLIDSFSVFFTTFILFLTILIYIYSCGDATDGIHEKEYGRYYILLFILLFSMFGIIYTNDLFNTYVFMEILAITTCSIISIKRKKENYTASFRYVMLNEIGSLSYLFGVALLYMITGYTNVELVSTTLKDIWHIYPSNIIIAIGFMVVGIGIKAAIFPFHIWLPDAHSHAPSSSSAILSAIVVKVYLLIMVKVLFRVFGVDILQALNLPLILMIIAGFGMIMGSFFALAQKDVKRMLGYSSVAQIGYIVLGIGLMTYLGLTAAFFHIISHGLMKAALFLCVGAIIYYKKIRNVDQFDGIAYKMPLTLVVFSIAALGMIGIPLTSGFISKLNLGVAALASGQIVFIVIIVISGLLNAMYYLPIMISAFLKGKKGEGSSGIEKIPKTMLFPILILGALILFLGIYPSIIAGLLEAAANTLM